MTVKGNQPTLQKTIQKHFDEFSKEKVRNKKVRVHQKTEKNRGRNECRTCTVAPAPKELRQQGWRDVKSVGMKHRVCERDGKTTEERVYFISSLPPKVRTFARHLRSHWTVENQWHWSLDVTFAEDDSRIRKGNGQEIASLFRRIALSLLKQNKTIQSSLRGKRFMTGWNTDLLEDILSGK